MAKKRTSRKTFDSSLPIFQLKITLDEIEPAIWRQIQTHNCTLADLHEIIQSCMGWENDHLYAFEVGDDEYSDSRRGSGLCDHKDSRSVRLSDLIERGEDRFVYEYDFGDAWRHTIEIKKTLPLEENVSYPHCADGARACPPEDCGGVPGYYCVLEALANPDDEEYDERLEWLGDDFDPEEFSVDAVNHVFSRLRRWMGRHPQLPGVSPRFAVGDRIRVKRGVAHSEYPDIPLGGWVGTVARIVWLFPVSYQVQWTEETLAASHPVYAKRCERDGNNSEIHWLDEGELEADSPEKPLEMEQPTNLITKPFDLEDSSDRIRMVFGLTSDDPLPEKNEASLQQYQDYLKTHLVFPFDANYCSDLTQFAGTNKQVSVVGLVTSLPFDTEQGLLGEIRYEEKTEQVPLTKLRLDEDNPGCQSIDDYRAWLWDVFDFAQYGDGNDIDWVEGDEGDEEDECWDEYDEEDEEDYEYDEVNFGPLLVGDSDDMDGDIPLQPIRHAQPQVGRNDPCPCGSGKKFKKCCLKKRDEHVSE